MLLPLCILDIKEKFKITLVEIYNIPYKKEKKLSP